jgi:hypothetical protein
MSDIAAADLPLPVLIPKQLGLGSQQPLLQF